MTHIVTAAILVIGDEILSGRTKDKNIGYIAEYLTNIGIDLKEVRVVPDEEVEIVAALNALRNRYTYVFTTGGIGPTHDDITADCVAKAFGVADRCRSARARHHGGELQVARHRDERGAAAHGAHPRGRRSGREPNQGPPGFWIGNVIVMAGVPSIMQVMLDSAAPKLKTGVKMISETVKGNVREGDIGTELGEIAKQHPNVSIGSYPFFDEKSGPNTNLVIRSRDAGKLAAAKADVEAMLVRVQAAIQASA